MLISWVVSCMSWSIHDQIYLILLVLSASSWVILKKHIGLLLKTFLIFHCTKCLGLQFNKHVEFGREVKDFIDSHYAINIDTRKSLSGYLFTMFGG